MGITIQGETVESIVQSRTRMGIYLIIGFDAILLAGIFVLYRYTRKEIKLAQMKSDFVANVSHELKTPLSLINMFAETLALGRVKTEEKAREYYAIIQQESSRLSKIVNKILNFSKIDAGKKNYNFAKYDLNSILKELYNSYKFHLENQGFEFKLKQEDGKGEAIIDKEAVTEAIINLIDNAVKYSREEKKIELSVERKNGFTAVSVSDRGIGIPEEDRKKIFDKFYRVPTGDVHDVKGTGLGLTLVKHIVDAHGGEVTVNSKVGKGTSFKLKFPAVNNTEEKP